MSNTTGWGPPGSGPSTWGPPPVQPAWGQQAPTGYGGYRPQQKGPLVYGGFWARFGGSLIDGLLLGAINIPVSLLCRIAGSSLATSTASCEKFQMNGYIYQRCTPSVGFVWFFLIVQLLISITVWWRLIPARMANSGATPGMKSVGLEIVTAHDHSMIGAGQAFARAIFAAIIPILFVLPVGLLALTADWRDIDHAEDIARVLSPLWLWGAAMGLSMFLYVLPWLWTVIDRRHQTLYDKFSGTVVIYRR